MGQNQMIYISPGYEKIWGRPAAELYLSPASGSKPSTPEDCERVKTAMLTKQIAGTYKEEYRTSVRTAAAVRCGTAPSRCGMPRARFIASSASPKTSPSNAN